MQKINNLYDRLNFLRFLSKKIQSNIFVVGSKMFIHYSVRSHRDKNLERKRN